MYSDFVNIRHNLVGASSLCRVAIVDDSSEDESDDDEDDAVGIPKQQRTPLGSYRNTTTTDVETPKVKTKKQKKTKLELRYVATGAVHEFDVTGLFNTGLPREVGK